MSENCNHDCSNCSQKCANPDPKSLLIPQNSNSDIKKVIGIVSGKGGVGKSLVTALLACAMKQRGQKVAVLDADITGPSIPKIFGAREHAVADEGGIYPVLSQTGIKTMSLNNLVDNETDPVIWRGPVIAGMIQQFWKDVQWGDIDVMFIDCPPGTGDVPLTVFQSIPLDGIIIAATPQELVSMIVSKAVNMAKMMNIPVLGLVENMSYLRCPDCGKEISLFGSGHTAETCAEMGIELLDRVPLDPELASLCDRGMIEDADTSVLVNSIQKILHL